jgi:hypothetical protein
MAMQDRAPMNEKMIEEEKRRAMYGYNAKQLDAQAAQEIATQNFGYAGNPVEAEMKLTEDQLKAKYMAMQDQGPMNEKMIEEENRRKGGLRAMRKEGYRQESNAPVPYSRGD